jgi:hypothetical protein
MPLPSNHGQGRAGKKRAKRQPKMSSSYRKPKLIRTKDVEHAAFVQLDKLYAAELERREYWTGAEADELLRSTVANQQTSKDPDKLDVFLDPETADKWLTRNKKNRKISPTAVERYVDVILKGEWRYNHQGLAFYPDGTLADGQKRLLAISQARVSVPIQVTLNLPFEAIDSIDSGQARSVADTATILTGHLFDAKRAAVGYRMKAQDNLTPGTSRHEQIEFLKRHEAAIQFAMEMIPRNTPVSRAPVRAVIARAFYTQDRERLERFCEILRTGKFDSNANEEAAWSLREHLLKFRTKSQQDGVDHYRKTAFALVRFLEGRPAPRLRHLEREPFLLPEEPGYRQAVKIQMQVRPQVQAAID